MSVAVVSDCRCRRATTAPWQPSTLVPALRGTLGCEEPGVESGQLARKGEGSARRRRQYLAVYDTDADSPMR